MTPPFDHPFRNVEIRAITAADTLPLRMAVLRPNRPASASLFPGDDAPSTRHLGAVQAGKIFGIASLFRAGMEDFPGRPAIQLRGMVTAPEFRGAGLGRALVFVCIDFARDNGAEILWCNARTSALGFYQKVNFEIVGGEFEIPDVGPHFRMLVWVQRSKPA